MNDELRKLFMNIFYEDHPASIQAEIDKDGELGIHIEGRGIELLVLSFRNSRKCREEIKTLEKGLY